jgi:hypothetical protein
MKEEIKGLNRDIRSFFVKSLQKLKIVTPVNSQSLWKAIRTAKDINSK